MKLVRVEEIPAVSNHRSKKRVGDMLANFVASDMQYALVVLEDDDYSRVEYARQSLIQACEKYGYRVDVKVRNGDIYLSKKGI